MNERVLRPELIVFAGPNGSGKTTITRLARVAGAYINADDIKRSTGVSDLEAAKRAEAMREDALSRHEDFTFETVMSTRRNLDLMIRAKDAGYFLRCIYVLTSNPAVNISRVFIREASGGHGVPTDKIISRYHKALALVPELVSICDIMHIYDNTNTPFRIFKRKKEEFFYWPNKEWDEEAVRSLTGISQQPTHSPAYP